MHSNIANKACVLRLNKLWKPIGVGLVSNSISALIKGTVLGVDIVYALNKDGSPNFDVQEYINLVSWDEWVKLPVHPWHHSIHSPKLTVRVPTVIITNRYSKNREKKFNGKPSKQMLAIRDNCIDGYTGKELDYNECTIDHVIPLSRGGDDTYENTVLTTKEINNAKGNRLNSEAGLTLIINPHKPSPIQVSSTIRKVRHVDWSAFITNKL